MGGYAGLHARWYDLVYGDKPYAEEAAFVNRLCGEPGGRLLDLACGTGRHAKAFDDLGYDVTGVDLNAELIEHARSRVPVGRFLVDDMRTVALDERFDVVTCLFDAIGYPLTNEGVSASLASVARHLADEGRFAIEFLHAPAMVRHARPVGVRRVALPDGGTLVRIAETTLDEQAHTMTVRYEMLALGADGRFSRSEETQANRFFDVEEMRELLGAAGLDVAKLVAAYSTDERIDDRTFHVVAVGGLR